MRARGVHEGLAMTRLLAWLFPTQRLVDEMAATIAYERERAAQEIGWWRAQCEMYRAREQRAVDRLLGLKVGVGPLTPEVVPPDTVQAQLLAAEQELLGQEEFARAGQV